MDDGKTWEKIGKPQETWPVSAFIPKILTTGMGNDTTNDPALMPGADYSVSMG